LGTYLKNKRRKRINFLFLSLSFHFSLGVLFVLNIRFEGRDDFMSQESIKVDGPEEWGCHDLIGAFKENEK